jgi:hypothetical protein
MNRELVHVTSAFCRYQHHTAWYVRRGDGAGFQLTPLHYSDPEAVAVEAAAKLRAGVCFEEVGAWIDAQEA